MSKLTKAQKAAKAEAIETLSKQIKPGQVIKTIVRHVSKSGMRREISCYLPLIDKDTGEARIWDISYLVAEATGHRFGNNGGVVIGGCGMDMGFEIVYNLGWALFPKGGDVVYSQRRHQEERAGKTIETDGGYLLRQEWL